MHFRPGFLDRERGSSEARTSSTREFTPPEGPYGCTENRDGVAPTTPTPSSRGTQFEGERPTLGGIRVPHTTPERS